MQANGSAQVNVDEVRAPTNSAVGNHIVNTDLGVDYYVEAVVGSLGDPMVEIRLYGRMADANNCYFCRFRDTTMAYEIRKRVTSSETVLNSGTMSGGFAASDMLRLEFEGTTIRAKENGTLVGSAADATFASGQGFGFILIWGNDAIASITVGNL